MHPGNQSNPSRKDKRGKENNESEQVQAYRFNLKATNEKLDIDNEL